MHSKVRGKILHDITNYLLDAEISYLGFILTSRIFFYSQFVVFRHVLRSQEVVLVQNHFFPMTLFFLPNKLKRVRLECK